MPGEASHLGRGEDGRCRTRPSVVDVLGFGSARDRRPGDRRRSGAWRGFGGCRRSLAGGRRRRIGEDGIAVIRQDLVGRRGVEGNPGIVDVVERHGVGVVTQCGDVGRREPTPLVENGRGRQIGRDREEVVLDRLRSASRLRVGIDAPRRLDERAVELENRLRRLFLVPQRDRQDPTGLQRPHIGFHRLARVGVFLDDGEATRRRKASGIGEAQIHHVVGIRVAREIEAAVVVDHVDARIVQDIAGEVPQRPVGPEGREDLRIRLGDRDALRAVAQRHSGRDAAAELDHEGLGILGHEIGVDHRQKSGNRPSRSQRGCE